MIHIYRNLTVFPLSRYITLSILVHFIRHRWINRREGQRWEGKSEVEWFIGIRSSLHHVHCNCYLLLPTYLLKMLKLKTTSIYPTGAGGSTAQMAHHMATEEASIACWLLAGGLSHLLQGFLHRTAWISSCQGSWPPQREWSNRERKEETTMPLMI